MNRVKPRAVALIALLLSGACTTMASSQAAPDCVPQAALDAYVQNSIDRKADVYAGLNPPPGGTAFVGSSLIEEGRWSEMFESDTVLNRGISAETTLDLLARIDALASDRPARIFLYTGGNNLSRRNETAEQTVSGVADVLDALADALPDTRVYLSTLLPREARHADNIAAVNAGLATLAMERGLTFIDAHGAFADADGALPASYTNDNIHLNAEGYALWASIIADGMGGLP